jgi:hypothetical protein
MGPNQSAILSGGFSPWQAPLAALFSGISAAAQPGGFANFGQGVQQGQQNFQQGQQQQQMMDLRRMQMEQAQEEMRRANQEETQRQATIERLRQLGSTTGSSTTPVNPVGGYGAATGGIQTASGTPQAAMFGDNPQVAAIFQGMLDAGDVKGALGLAAEYATQEPEAEKLTDDQREYQFAQSQGYEGSLLDFIMGQKKAGAPSTTVNNSISSGESPADAAQRKKLSEAEGERWSALQESGTVAAGLQQDFEALDQLINVVPSGPVEGRLAEAFPGFSSAGDAFQSIVVRVAPSLRTPGSGATSDVEYEGMLKSLPRLRNQPEANAAIAAMMKSKAALNAERAAVVTAYQNEEITAADARRALKELNDRSIMTPELKAALEGVGATDDGGWKEINGVRIRQKPNG